MRAALLIAVAALAAGPVLANPDRGSMEHRDGFRDAVTAPLDDLNLKQVEIPAVLERAVANPYAMNGMARCEGVAGEVGRLDAALGRDLDEAPPPDKRTRTQRVGAAVHDAGVSAVRDETRDLLPFRGWVRKLSGAERHQKAVQQAIKAGGIRRGYLKGVGMRMNCAPPAAPSWFVPARPRPAPTKSAASDLLSRSAEWIESVWPF
jgi:hypothetical protein